MERQADQVTTFLADVVGPGLQQVKAALTAPGRDREVEIRSGQNSTTIYVTDPAQRFPRTSELYVRFGFQVGRPPATWVHLDSAVGVDTDWRMNPNLSGSMDGINQDKIAEGVMALWLDAVNTGKG